MNYWFLRWPRRRLVTGCVTGGCIKIFKTLENPQAQYKIIYPLVNVNKKLWEITMLSMGKLTSFQLDHFQEQTVSHYQRVDGRKSWRWDSKDGFQNGKVCAKQGDEVGLWWAALGFGWLVVTWTWLLFFHILRIVIPHDSYFSEGLKPPTSHGFAEVWQGQACKWSLEMDGNGGFRLHLGRNQ